MARLIAETPLRTLGTSTGDLSLANLHVLVNDGLAPSIHVKPDAVKEAIPAEIARWSAELLDASDDYASCRNELCDTFGIGDIRAQQVLMICFATRFNKNIRMQTAATLFRTSPSNLGKKKNQIKARLPYHLAFAIGVTTLWAKKHIVLQATSLAAGAVLIVLFFLHQERLLPEPDLLRTENGNVPCEEGRRGCDVAGTYCLSLAESADLLWCSCFGEDGFGRWNRSPTCSATEQKRPRGYCALGQKCKTEYSYCRPLQLGNAPEILICDQGHWSDRQARREKPTSTLKNSCELGAPCNIVTSTCMSLDNRLMRCDLESMVSTGPVPSAHDQFASAPGRWAYAPAWEP